MSDEQIRFANVSKFYGEVLGVNRVELTIDPGITSLVGPNGSGKSTLMNLMTGLLRPTRGTISLLGLGPDQPEELFRRVGYCTQFDSFPRGVTGLDFIYGFLRVHGFAAARARELTDQALTRVNMVEAARRKVAGYSKGMRQRIKLAQAIAHEPDVLVLDEPLNGLDPQARAEVIGLFREFGETGRHVIVSSHILHEVDQISDRVVLLKGGYVVADGGIQEVRDEVKSQPMQVLVRADRPGFLASKLFAADHCVEAEIQEDNHGLLIRTLDADRFFLELNRIVVEEELVVETVAPADSDVHAVYRYLIESEEATR